MSRTSTRQAHANAHGWWLRLLRRPSPPDPGPVDRFLWGFWVLNAIAFICLVPFTLLDAGAGWPLRIATAAGLVGACLWEAAALRARRFPLWADVLETATVALLAWRFPGQTGPPLILFVVTFALAGLGFRVLYGSPWQAAVRTITMLGAIYVGRLLSVGGEPAVVLDRMVPVLLPTAFVAVMCGLLIRMPAVAARARRVAERLNADLLAAGSRDEVHTAILRAVLDLLANRSDIRVILWEDRDGVRPTRAAGNRADEVFSDPDPDVVLPSWLQDPIQAGESVYREAVDYDDREELRRAIGFDPITGATFAVPMHADSALKVLTVGSRNPISGLERREIENLVKVFAMTLGSMALTERLRTSQDALHRRSNYDPLTRLPNRALLVRRLERALAERDRRVALLLLDLDHFNAINDSLGVLAGDEALVTVARRIAGSVRPGDMVARLGDDEFAVFLDGLDDPAELELVAGRILESLNAPITGLLGRATDVFARASVGVARADPTVLDPHDLLANADIAMHEAKADGGAVWRVFEPAMRTAVLDRLELESDLHRALERGELVVHYQPVVGLTSGGTVGVEALARWHHPTRGLIPAASFIAVAEESGLINEIGAWILREGCRQLRLWSAADPRLERLFLNVNLSPRQLAQPDLARWVGATIAEVGIDPARVTLELTESVLIENTEANLDRLRALKALGVRLAVDDFGTGFSSLSYLQRFPFDAIKIDRAFVHGVDGDPDGDTAALARAIISMGRALGLACVAEGVETRSQMEWLRGAACDAAQGHLFAPALPPDEVFPLLTGDFSALARQR